MGIKAFLGPPTNSPNTKFTSTPSKTYRRTKDSPVTLVDRKEVGKNTRKPTTSLVLRRNTSKLQKTDFILLQVLLFTQHSTNMGN